MLRVRIGDIVFHGLTDRGFLITPGGFKGWRGGVPLDGDSVKRPGAHGMFALPRFLGERTVTIEGAVLGDSEEEALQLAMILGGLGASGDRFKVVVDEGGETTWGWAQAQAMADIDWLIGGGSVAEFQLQLSMSDPRKYGETRSVTPAASVPTAMFHRGNFDAFPVFTAKGPQPGGWSVVAPGQPTFRNEAPLAAGSTEVVDFATQRVTRDGVIYESQSVTSISWAVPGGGEQEWWSVPTGSGQITGSITDTFV